MMRVTASTPALTHDIRAYTATSSPATIGKAPTFDSDIERSAQWMPIDDSPSSFLKGNTMTYDRLTIAVPSMSKHHATMIRVATSRMLDASIKYASTNDRRHFDDMVSYQDMLWSIVKQVATTTE